MFRELFNGCIIASVAHAISMSRDPDFSYEQSWDGNNYSFKQLFGFEGTFTFCSSYSCGAVRINQNGARLRYEYVSYYPNIINETINNECLQYLLEDFNGLIKPEFSFSFWISEKEVISLDDEHNNLKTVLSLFLGPQKSIYDTWIRYYSLESSEISLLHYITSLRLRSGSNNLYVKRSVVEDHKITISEELIESLKEMHIILV